MWYTRVGWDPPIEEILAAAIDDPKQHLSDAPQGGRGGIQQQQQQQQDPVEKQKPCNRMHQYRLSMVDLYLLVMELYDTFMRMEIAGTKLLKLLASVCAPGNVVDPKSQSFLASLILGTVSSDGDHAAPQIPSLLFSLTYKDEVWKVHLSQNQERPMYVPDEEELVSFSEAEKNMIRDAFFRYDKDGNGTIDQDELGMLLLDLGMQVSCVAECFRFPLYSPI